MTNLLMHLGGGVVPLALAAFVTGVIVGAWLREVACGAALGRMDTRDARTRGQLRTCQDELDLLKNSKRTEDDQ